MTPMKSAARLFSAAQKIDRQDGICGAFSRPLSQQTPIVREGV
jgi:hypothetical protein